MTSKRKKPIARRQRKADRKPPEKTMAIKQWKSAGNLRLYKLEA